jgi:hypothetical protein
MAYMLERCLMLLSLMIVVMVFVMVKVRVIVNVIAMVMVMMMLPHDAGLDMVVGEFQVAVAPTLVESHHQACCLFGELRILHLVIDAVLVFTGSFLAPASVPYESLLIA